MSFSIWNSKEGSISYKTDEEIDSQNNSEETEQILEESDENELIFD